MELRIYWTDFSKREIKKIYFYYKKNASKQVAKHLITDITNKVIILKKYPEAGQKEQLLINRKQDFRYLVHKNYKIIYWINKKKMQIEIVDVFDTRQNPVMIKRLK